mmetsp:Transcript_9432/g.21388  ORF Transcript_9432/g.21388 Transcript_9432/m.21388 type:complete len:358 (+) Transcript_9432:1394-2467(+)
MTGQTAQRRSDPPKQRQVTPHRRGRRGRGGGVLTLAPLAEGHVALLHDEPEVARAHGEAEVEEPRGVADPAQLHRRHLLEQPVDPAAAPLHRHPRRAPDAPRPGTGRRHDAPEAALPEARLVVELVLFGVEERRGEELEQPGRRARPRDQRDAAGEEQREAGQGGGAAQVAVQHGQHVGAVPGAEGLHGGPLESPAVGRQGEAEQGQQRELVALGVRGEPGHGGRVGLRRRAGALGPERAVEPEAREAREAVVPALPVAHRGRLDQVQVEAQGEAAEREQRLSTRVTRLVRGRVGAEARGNGDEEVVVLVLLGLGRLGRLDRLGRPVTDGGRGRRRPRLDRRREPGRRLATRVGRVL